METEKTYEVHPMLEGKAPLDLPEEGKTAQDILEIPKEVVEEAAAQEAPEPRPEPKKEGWQARNFRVLREAKERLERENEELRLQAQRYKPQEESPRDILSRAEPEDDFGIKDDELVEGKQLAKVKRELNYIKKELNTYKAQSSEKITEARIRSEFPDFNAVVTQHNIQMLNAAYPEVGRLLSESSDLYSKAVTAYQMIKTFGIDQPDNYNPVKEKIEANKTKPRNSMSVASTQTGGESGLQRTNAFAEGFNDTTKKALYKEMLASMKNR